MLVLPGPGVLVLAFGIVLLGPRDPALRRAAIALRLLLRRLSHAERSYIRSPGRWLLRRHRHARTLIREQVDRHAHGQPLTPSARRLICLAVILAVAGICASVYLLLSS